MLSSRIYLRSMALVASTIIACAATQMRPVSAQLAKNPAPCEGDHTCRKRRSGILVLSVVPEVPADRGMAMLNLLTFAAVAVALGMPLVVPLMWGQIEKA
jgi:hypothetical protein